MNVDELNDFFKKVRERDAELFKSYKYGNYEIPYKKNN